MKTDHRGNLTREKGGKSNIKTGGGDRKNGMTQKRKKRTGETIKK